MTAQDEIDKKRREIAALEAHQRSCAHSFLPMYYDPIVVRGHQVEDYMFPQPGRMVWIDEKVTPQWSRKCSLCGLVESTKKTKPITRPGSVAGTTTTDQVPDFGEERRPTFKVP